jgi:hypothetical protein
LNHLTLTASNIPAASSKAAGLTRVAPLRLRALQLGHQRMAEVDGQHLARLQPALLVSHQGFHHRALGPGLRRSMFGAAR